MSTQCLIIWPPCKNIARQTFLLEARIKCCWRCEIFFIKQILLVKRPNIAWKPNIRSLTKIYDRLATLQKLCSSNMFCLRNVEVFENIANQILLVTHCFVTWPNDQALLVKHLKFAFQAKCLTLWPCRKTKQSNIFCLFLLCLNYLKTLRNKNVHFWSPMFFDEDKQPNVAWQENLKCLTNNTFIVLPRPKRNNKKSVSPENLLTQLDCVTWMEIIAEVAKQQPSYQPEKIKKYFWITIWSIFAVLSLRTSFFFCSICNCNSFLTCIYSLFCVELYLKWILVKKLKSYSDQTFLKN